MNIPTNEELVAMANVFDEFVIEFCDEYRMSPLASSGLMLARLSKLAKELGYIDDYRKLLIEITKLNDDTTTVVSNNSTTH